MHQERFQDGEGVLVSDTELWNLIVENRNVVQWVLFKKIPKSLTMYAFGGGRDATHDCLIVIFKSIRSRQRLLEKYTISGLMTRHVHWLLSKRIDHRMRHDLKIDDIDTQLLPDRHDDDWLSNDELKSMTDDIALAMRSLTSREREIIKLNFGIGGDGYCYSYEEIGRIFKITRTRVWQIKTKAIRKLRNSPHPKNILKHYCECMS